MEESDHDHEECNTGLCLGLGGGHVAKKEKKQKLVNKPLMACFDLAFELSPKGEAMNVYNNNHNNMKKKKGERLSLERQQNYPNVTSSTDSENNNNNNNNNNDSRKKLRLTKEQSTILENTFKLHNTLNPVFIHSY
jgi:hypothetical protein